MIVLFWSRATTDLLRSFGWGIAALHRENAATKLPFLAARPHSVYRSRREVRGRRFDAREIDCARRTMIRMFSARRDCGRGCLMGKAHLVVRAEVPDPADRAAFDHWYATDHLPWAMRVFGARSGWRCWSRTDPGVHYAFYEFADIDEVRAATDAEKIVPLVADFDRVWGSRVSQRREIVEIVQEIGSSVP